MTDEQIRFWQNHPLSNGLIVGHGHCGALAVTMPDVGGVTVDFRMRNFTLGFFPVRTMGKYKGRGWEVSLMRDAIQKLKDTL